MTTYTFTVANGFTMLQLNRQSLEQCFDRVGALRTSDPDGLCKIVLTMRDGKTVTIEQEPEKDLFEGVEPYKNGENFRLKDS